MAIYNGDNKIADLLPDIGPNTVGKFLTNDGEDTSWVDILPTIPSSGIYTLKVINGTLTWVEDI